MDDQCQVPFGFGNDFVLWNELDEVLCQDAWGEDIDPDTKQGGGINDLAALQTLEIEPPEEPFPSDSDRSSPEELDPRGLTSTHSREDPEILDSEHICADLNEVPAHEDEQLRSEDQGFVHGPRWIIFPDEAADLSDRKLDDISYSSKPPAYRSGLPVDGLRLTELSVQAAKSLEGDRVPCNEPQAQENERIAGGPWFLNTSTNDSEHVEEEIDLLQWHESSAIGSCSNELSLHPTNLGLNNVPHSDDEVGILERDEEDVQAIEGPEVLGPEVIDLTVDDTKSSEEPDKLGSTQRNETPQRVSTQSEVIDLTGIQSEDELDELSAPQEDCIGVSFPRPSKKNPRKRAFDQYATLDGNGSDDTVQESRHAKVRATATVSQQGELSGPKRHLQIDCIMPRLKGPKSEYLGWKPPSTIMSEQSALLKLEIPQGDFLSGHFEDSFEQIELHHFSIYRLCPVSDKRKGDSSVEALSSTSAELASLQNLRTLGGHRVYYFDGVLSDAKRNYYVQRVPFSQLSIGEAHHSRDQIWIRSTFNEDRNIWYNLKWPLLEYSYYYNHFLRIATFSKYFTSFLTSHRSAKLVDFKDKFYAWAKFLHRHNQEFQKWCQRFSGTDFRSFLTANPGFLWKEATDIEKELEGHSIWGEFHPELLDAAIKLKPGVSSIVVTPFVKDCFEHLSWGSFLQGILPRCNYVKTSLEPPASVPMSFDWTIAERALCADSLLEPVKAGDVVLCLDVGGGRDLEQWFAYVQDVLTNQRGRQFLHVLWLYKPADTTCGKMLYPFPNELFLSDQCTEKLEIERVMCKVPVSFSISTCPSQSNGSYFVCRTFRTTDHAFANLETPDFECVHRGCKSDFQRVKETYCVGDTVLVGNKGSDTLNPVEILELNQKKRKVLCRRLLPAQELRSNAAPNELLYTETTFWVPAEFVERKCLVRFYSAKDQGDRKIPAPYNRNGTGDAYYISYRYQNSTQRLEPLEAMPTGLVESFDPTAQPSRPPLKALDLWGCGGSFGRGLEEGGAISVQWCVDVSSAEIHTQRANAKPKYSGAQFYLGDISNFLACCMAGKPGYPKAGEVEMIIAEPPSQPFSNANRYTMTVNAQEGRALVALVAACIDFFRPKYALIENLLCLAGKSHVPGEDVFAQLVCCLLGMGYQVQQFNLDAWSFGGAANQSRLYISIAAPGCKLPPPPAPSHSHPKGTPSRCISRLANRKQVGMRKFGSTPFNHITLKEAIQDLPPPFPDFSPFDADSGSQFYLSHPDHRPPNPKTLTPQNTALIGLIPKYPPTSALNTAFDRKVLPRPLLERHEASFRHRKFKVSRAWGRYDGNKITPTLGSCMRQGCNNSGRTLHYEQDRFLTVLEGRRLQGIPDHEILVGTEGQGWRIVAGSVARGVAMTLGLGIREAWVGDLGI